MKKIIFTQPDGRLAVMKPLAAVEVVLSKLEGTDARVVDALGFPDKYFRDAWTIDLTVDMAKARVIHRERLRGRRGALFAKFDADWMRCTASGDVVGASNAEAKRQLLRDSTQYPAIDAASTPDELKAAIPPILQ